jgi:hypothetical protein
MPARWFLAAAALAPLLTACPMPLSNAARMQEAASDFNTNVRFGRMSLAVEKVAPKEREEFLAHRRGWGETLQLADYELLSAKMVKDGEAEVVVKYDWYVVTAGDLHTTTIRQTWGDHLGTWLLEREERDAGAMGLFGEPTSEPARPRTTQFPTVRLGD